MIIHSDFFRSTVPLTAPELLSFFNEFTLWSLICLYSSLTSKMDLFVLCPGIRIFQSISHSCGSSLKPLQRLINLVSCCTQWKPALKPAGNTGCLLYVQELQFPCNQSTNPGIVTAHHVDDALARSPSLSDSPKSWRVLCSVTFLVSHCYRIILAALKRPFVALLSIYELPSLWS